MYTGGNAIDTMTIDEANIEETLYKLPISTNMNKYKEAIVSSVVSEMPSRPLLLSPLPNATGVPTTATFLWHTNPMQNVTTYWFELDTEDTLGIAGRYTDSTLTDTTTTVFNLPNNVVRYWRVKAKNPLGWGGFSYWRKFRTSTTGAKEEQENKYSFSLEQNYPNPFNPATVISYQLKVKSEVTIKIYDILGKEVEIGRAHV